MPQLKLKLGLIEGGLTLSGVTAALTPLALWTAWSEFVFYLVLSVGCAAFLVFIGLARLRGVLAPEKGSGSPTMDFDSLQRRRTDWENAQRLAPEGRRKPATKGAARREFAYMMRITVGLILTAVLLFVAVWALLEFRYS